MKKTLLYQTLFMEMGVKVPDGVEYPALPVDTGQSYRCTPSNKTVILCLVLSMLMTMVGAAGFVALGREPSFRFFTAHIGIIVPRHARVIAFASR